MDYSTHWEWEGIEVGLERETGIEVKWVIFLLSQISSNDFRWREAIGQHAYLYPF